MKIILFFAIATLLMVLFSVMIGSYFFPKWHPTLIDEDGSISLLNACLSGILYCLAIIILLLTIGCAFEHITIKPFKP